MKFKFFFYIRKMLSTELDVTARRYIELIGSEKSNNFLFPDNSIISYKYTALSFLPKSLLSQFYNLPKLWFLLISVLELTQRTTVTISYGTVLPLVLLIILGLFRDGYSEYLQHISDSKVNYQLQRVWNGTTFITTPCKQILVGDVILLENNETAPADMVILSAGNEEHECYADVSAVIGESNLKVKHPIKEVQNILDSLDFAQAATSLPTIQLELLISLPNKSFKQFTGKSKLTVAPTAHALDINNLLLRGMKITNTPWIFGLVVYTGVETKVWINNLIRPTKVPQLRKILDTWMLWMFPIILLISGVNTVIAQFSRVEGYKWEDIFLNNLILFNHMVQISLYLAIELVRIFLSFTNSYLASGVQLNNINLLSNLGMVEYIVTDKTGTLTENSLNTALIVVTERLFFNSKSVNDHEQVDGNHSASRLAPNRVPANYEGETYSFQELYEEFNNDEKNPKLSHFFTCLAICNLAFPQENDYIAISVDDKVLAKTAADFGIQMVARESDTCTLKVQGTEITYEVLGTQAFSSDIKTSRIVVRNYYNNQAIMYVKGSRESMINIYDPSTYSRQDLEDGILQYRCLFLGVKKLTLEEANQFQFDYETAQLSPVNRQGRVEIVFQKFEKGLEYLGIVGLEDIVTDETRNAVLCLKEAGIKFWVLSGDSEESTLTTSIASGVFTTEQKIIRLVNFSSELDCMNVLQDSIKENIYLEMFSEKHAIDEDGSLSIPMAFSDANVPNLGSVFSVLSVEDMPQMQIPRRKLRKSTLFAREMQRKASVHPLVSRLSIVKRKTSLEGEYNPKNLKFILSIDSSGLEYGTSTKEHLLYFTSLLFTAKAVCFHSLLPDQKTKVIKLIKYNFRFNPIVMSIGDGISDVGMIHAADIGIGVEGLETSVAALNSDVSIKKFSQLLDLLLVYGHRQYIQLSKMVLLSFYVMALLEVELVLYNPVSGWTAQSIMQREFLLVYRLVVNILPITAMCLIDKDSSSTFISPKAYKAGIFNCLLTKRNLAMYVLMGVVQAGFTFLCTEFFFTGISNEGDTENMVLIGASVFIISSSTVFVSILIETYSISLRTLGVYTCCIGIWLASVLPLSVADLEISNFMDFLSRYRNIWVHIFFTTLFNVAICYTFKACRYIFFPNIIEKVRLTTPNNTIQLDSRLKQYKKTLKNVFKDSEVLKHSSNYEDAAINFTWMKFMSKYREENYQADKLVENSNIFKILLLLGGSSVAIYSIYVLLYNKPKFPAIIFHAICSGISILAFIGPSFSSFRVHTLMYLICNYVFIQMFYLISEVAFDFESLTMCSFLPVLYLIGFSNYWLEISILVTFSTVISIIISAFQFSNTHADISELSLEVITYSVIYIAVCIMSSIVAYHIDKSKRDEFVLVQRVQIEIQKTKSVLTYLLPAFVMKRVQDGERYISDYQGVVSVIFCDIYNFESILKYYTPQELTAFLDEVFGKFDQICMLSGCTKIETVGKTYMACAGLRDSDIELDPYYSKVPHARRCIEMGLAIVRNAEKIYLKSREILQFKIGIHSGPVTAGVVGFHKPQFSLVGDTVNTASRMASLCPNSNTLQISKETYDFIGDTIGLVFEPFEVIAKGKGPMKTFLVSVPEVELSSSPEKKSADFGSVSEINKKRGGKQAKTTKKATLYHFNNMHSEHNKRKSSLIDELEAEVANEFIRKETEQLEKIRWLSIGCKETRTEKKFRIESSETAYPITMNGLMLRVVIDGIVFLVIAIKVALFSANYSEILIIFVEVFVFTLLALKFKKFYKRIWYSWLISMFSLVSALVKIFVFTSEERTFISLVYHLLQAAHCSQLLFKNFSWTGAFLIVIFVIRAGILQYRNWLLHILASIIFYCILLFTLHTREKKLRYFTILNKSAKKKLKKTEELLTQMMPKHVFESLKDHNSVTESISKVTIMYADIVGFTAWSSDKTPGEVVNMLSELFTEFDKKCLEFEVYKVHTIGDCYVAMGYTGVKPRSENQECYSLAKFALALGGIIREKNKENGIDLDMRIGIHTGDIIGGIAGTNIVRYDIYGVDVYIANKMESTGKAGAVKISETTMKILHNNWPLSFVFTRDDNVDIPVTNSRIKTFILENSPTEANCQD